MKNHLPPGDSQEDTPQEANPTGQLVLSPHWNASLVPLKHSWEGLVNIDQFRWVVRRDTQEHLRMAYEELGARHMRAVGIFDDELRVMRGVNAVERDEDVYNFNVVDYCIDSLLDVGINPMFTTCFTPSILSTGESRLFLTKANSSPPKDWNRWADLVKRTLEHFIWRYGRNRVREWYCEVWNEPNLEPFWHGDQETFYHLWETTYNAIKSVDPHCRIGGPSTARAEWIEDFITYGRKNDCEPDYIVGHIYNNDSESKPLSPFDGSQADKESKSPHFADAVIRGARQLLDSLNFKGELQWNEWGRSWYPSFPARETSNEAAYVVKSMYAISNYVDQLAPWCLSDIYDQCGYSHKEFTGNYGLINLHGLRKPAYNAYRLLSRLGQERYPMDNRKPGESSMAGAIVSPVDTGGFQALVYHYCHQDEQPSGTVEVVLQLPDNFNPGGCRLTVIDETENNILSEWKDRGSPAYFGREEISDLRKQNVELNLSNRPVRISNGVASFDVQRGSVALLEVNP